MKDHQPSLTPAFSFVQASFWMSFCSAVGFAAVYLLGMHYTNFVLGLVMAGGNLLGAVLGTFLCDRIDRSETVTASRLIPPMLVLQTAAILTVLFHPVKDWLTACAYAVYIMFTLSVNSLNLKLYSDALHSGKTINYGFTRGIGSAAYVLVSGIMGVVVERYSIRWVPLSGLLLCAVQFLAFFIMSGKLAKGASASGKEAEKGIPFGEFILKNRSFSILLAGIALVFFAHNLSGMFLINITRNVGGDTSDMGFLNAFIAAVEIPVMMFYQQFFGKKDPAAMLRIAFTVFSIKSIAIALAGSLPMLYAAYLFQAPSFALEAAAIVPYVDRTVRYEDSARAQSLAFTMTIVGSVLASIFGGLLYDKTSVSTTLWVGFAICLAGSATALLGIGRKAQ